MSQQITNLELALDHSHRCNQCRYTFLKSADGCPHCGPDALTSSLSNDEPLIPDDAEVLSKTTYNHETGEFS